MRYSLITAFVVCLMFGCDLMEDPASYSSAPPSKVFVHIDIASGGYADTSVDEYITIEYTFTIEAPGAICVCSKTSDPGIIAIASRTLSFYASNEITHIGDPINPNSYLIPTHSVMYVMGQGQCPYDPSASLVGYLINMDDYKHLKYIIVSDHSGTCGGTGQNPYKAADDLGVEL